MRKDIAATATLRPFGMLKAAASIGALPRNARTMLIYDATLAWSALLLLAIGLVMVYSASIAAAEASGHTGYRAWYFLLRHGLSLVAGSPPRPSRSRCRCRLAALAPWLFALGALLLVLVLIPGSASR